MADITIEVDNSPEVLRELDSKIKAALNACGIQAVSHASQNVDQAGRVDTGRLVGSINYRVNGDTVHVGTDVEYAQYNEFGTGIYAGGRTTPWAFKDASGNWHMTRGMAGIHFLKNAIANNIDEYKSIIEDQLK